ncbi:MAG: hypothetical protein RMX96_09440 [Nostoc sp. ChiSLP02]|nr:hypothetical protein [Nostoc sp. DedSLP05]MDZ8101964.1 hypothetical protein [Nostoc sp. DedSLP01]MDZ8185063.1 hypothetical protein [Nostoc sp. ChiSLP02]
MAANTKDTSASSLDLLESQIASVLTAQQEAIKKFPAIQKYKDDCNCSFNIGIQPLYLHNEIATLTAFLQNFIDTLAKAWDLGLQTWPPFNQTPLQSQVNQVGAAKIPRLMRVDFTSLAGIPQIFEIEHNPSGLGIITLFQKVWGYEPTLAQQYRDRICDNIHVLLTQKDLDYYDARFFVREMSGNPEQVHLLGELKPEFFQQDKLYIHRYFDPWKIEAETESPLKTNLELLLQSWVEGKIEIEPHPDILMSKLGLASIFSETSIWEKAGLNLEIAQRIIPEIKLLSAITEEIPERQKSVIKILTPDQSYGSRGVKVGSYQRAQKWIDLVRELRANHTLAVVQRLVEHQKVTLPFIDDSDAVQQQQLDVLYRAFFLRTDTGLTFAGGYYVGCAANTKSGKVSGVSGVRGPIFE